MFDSEPTSLDPKLQSTPLRVHDVVISGNTRTKPHVIERHLKSAREAGTVGELISASNAAQDGLQRLNLLESVQIVVDAGPAELPDTANINVMVEELRDEHSYTFEPCVQSQEQTRGASGKMLNAMGLGEEVGIKACLDQEGSPSVECTYSHPNILESEFDLQAGYNFGRKSYDNNSSHSLHHNGGSISLSHTKDHAKREFGYDLASRTNTVTPGASPAMHEQAGHSILSAVWYKYSVRGERFSWTHNAHLGGIGLSWKLPTFLKLGVSLHRTFPLPFANATLGVTACAGHLLHRGTSHNHDRFSQGGFTDIRGLHTWDPKSGRQVERNSIGGNSSASLTADLTFDLPFHLTDRLGMRGHVFGCAGNVGWAYRMGGMWRSRSNFNEYMKDTWGSTLVSGGAGIVIPMKGFEANITYVLHKLQSDKAAEAKFGFQLGYGNSLR